MAYIVTATIYLDDEVNLSGDCKYVRARKLSERDGYVTFCLPGDFGKHKEITRDLCNAIIDAGFVSFNICHSY